MPTNAPCRGPISCAPILAGAILGAFSPFAAHAAYSPANTLDLHPAALTYSSGNALFGVQQVGGGYNATFEDEHAFLWSSSPTGSLDLHPSGLIGSTPLGVYAGRQVGYASGSFPGVGIQSHAILWNNAATGFIDLHPAGGYESSVANGIFANQQVGYAAGTLTGGDPRAFLWTGTAASAVNLHPAGFLRSMAYATDGTRQVGFAAGPFTSNANHAFLWNGSANAFTDLHPTGFNNSQALAISGNQQVGFANGSGITYAMLWTGSAASVVNLHPAGYTVSTATGTNGHLQVGHGAGPLANFATHALLWAGSAGSVFDLHTLLPGSPSSSTALGIDPYGNIVGNASYGGGSRAVVWLAGNTYKTPAASGHWDNPANWTGGLPVAGQDVLILKSDATDHTMGYFRASPAPQLGNLTLDATHTGRLTLFQGQDELRTTNETLGFLGRGEFYQNGGLHSVSGTLTLGARPGATGFYTLNAGTLTSTAVHINTDSLFYQSGGRHVVGGELVIGERPDAAGIYTLAAGTLTAAHVRVQNSGTFHFDGGVLRAQALTLADNGHLSMLTAAPKILRTSAMSIGPNTALDLTTHLLLMDTAGPADKASKIAQLAAYIESAKNNGFPWFGPGITSTTVPTTPSTALALADNADLQFTTFRGEPVDGSVLLVMQAHFGDANFDGRVDAFDLNLLAGHWQQPSGALWSAGDFNGDRAVNAFDLNILAAHWQFGTTNFEAALATFVPSVSVPEPASLALLLLILPMLRHRQRARSCTLGFCPPLPRSCPLPPCHYLRGHAPPTLTRKAKSLRFLSPSAAGSPIAGDDT